MFNMLLVTARHQMLSFLKGPLNFSQMFLGISIKLANLVIYML